MRKRGENGRFVGEPDGGREKVAVEGRETKRLPKAPAAETLRRFTRERVAEGYPTIVDTFVRRAKAGSVAHARALASLGGLDKRQAAAKKPAARRGKTLGRRLMEELDRVKERARERAEAKAKKDAAATGDAEAAAEAPTEGEGAEAQGC